MYDKICQFIKDNSLICILLAIVILLSCFGLWYGKSYRCPTYRQAGEQLADVEGQRQRVEAGLTESQQTVNSISKRIRDSQQTINRAEARYSSAGDIFTECEQIITELRRRAEERAASK